MKKNKTGNKKTKRISFPSDEKVHSWLSMLLDAYYVVDKGIFNAIEHEQNQGRKLACKQGCSNCCSTHKDIPVYPLELIGISWYATEKISGAEREALKKQLKNHSENNPCPFLLNGLCSVHPVRPIACRQFNVFGDPCEEGEDAYHTRREDVMPPVKRHVDQAFFIMLPFYGVEKEPDRNKVIDAGSMHRMARRLQDCNWTSLTDKMENFDGKASG